jgi:hypothetical protein
MKDKACAGWRAMAWTLPRWAARSRRLSRQRGQEVPSAAAKGSTTAEPAKASSLAQLTDEFNDLLRQADVQIVVDVRTVPRLRANPQSNRDMLPETLSAFQIGYEHLPLWAVCGVGTAMFRQPRTPAG